MRSKILVVDDEIIMRELLYDVLANDPYHVVLAANAEEALEEIEEMDFDLIISDIKMPNMDGIELMKRIKELEVDSSVIFITGYASIDTAVEAIKLGASDYIEKPFSLEEFKNLVAKVLAEHDLRNAIMDNKVLLYTMNRAVLNVNTI